MGAAAWACWQEGVCTNQMPACAPAVHAMPSSRSLPIPCSRASAGIAMHCSCMPATSVCVTLPPPAALQVGRGALHPEGRQGAQREGHCGAHPAQVLPPAAVWRHGQHEERVCHQVGGGGWHVCVCVGGVWRRVSSVCVAGGWYVVVRWSGCVVMQVCCDPCGDARGVQGYRLSRSAWCQPVPLGPGVCDRSHMRSF
jgi:hypothetical protein